jgi:hypothetical protein
MQRRIGHRVWPKLLQPPARFVARQAAREITFAAAANSATSRGFVCVAMVVMRQLIEEWSNQVLAS